MDQEGFTTSKSIDEVISSLSNSDSIVGSSKERFYYRHSSLLYVSTIASRKL